MITGHGSLRAYCASLTQPEDPESPEALLPAANLISDWVPFSTHMNLNDGSSGMWNWTCSVFSAITAASSLASGSLHLPSEQHHMETNLRATFSGVSIILSFRDDEQSCFYKSKIGNTVGSQIDYLGAECNEIVVALK
ncbi:hypothetical protein KIW84_030248 [Lathyrus oleraceus]|uniref:Uncharacterized protein n=1 Tax=Pisum sativum TaxID=3888 RepID=A0A9D5AVY9_PEA|nr:hypothetical protein KIW84_030246 [Pisum sativum]KAI5423953.1 hypothetical protein KIW84_030248 [Pisum sativum]